MPRFIQLHVLTAYPPSNLNRDDTGRPKSATVGGVPRLRVSSQSLKRAWRTSEVFRMALGESREREHGTPDRHLGTRTKTLGLEVFKQIAGVEDINLAVVNRFKEAAIKQAFEATREIVRQFGKLDGDYPPKKGQSKQGDESVAAVEGEVAEAVNEEKAGKEDEGTGNLKAFKKALSTGQLFHISPNEAAAVSQLASTIGTPPRLPKAEELSLLRADHHAVDISLFGRMLAEKPRFNTEAAVQVAHAFTVHKAVADDDYFTAVDDLNRGEEDLGAGHVGEMGFGSGVFYLYVCINRALLGDREHLGEDAELRKSAIAALIKAIAKVSPTGKQNSFASRAYASLVLAEVGEEQPRSLAAAFVQPVGGGDMIADAIHRLTSKRHGMESMYGPCAKDYRIAIDGEYEQRLDKDDRPVDDNRKKVVSLEDLIKFVNED